MPQGVIDAHARATNDLASLDKLGKVSKHDARSLEVEIPSQMITKDNTAQFFCKASVTCPECK